MKNRTSIFHFTGREQIAIRQLKNRIVATLQPLFIYFIDSVYSSQFERSAFVSNIKDGHWEYRVRLLLVSEEGKPFDEKQLQVFIDGIEPPIKLDFIHCSITEMKERLSDYNLFFNWIRHKGILLYQGNFIMESLPTLDCGIKKYSHQIKEWYERDATLSTAFTQKLDPIPAISNQDSKRKTEMMQPYIIRNYGHLNLIVKGVD